MISVNKVFLNNTTMSELVSRVEEVGFMALDTEFNKSRSYFAILALVQIHLGEGPVYILDVLDKKTDCEPFFSLIKDKRIVKVIHACRQDSEALYRTCGVKINNIIDTQLMAREIGFGNQISYCNLVSKLCGVTIDKKFQYSNWLKRPLNSSLIDYAAIDALHLTHVYKQMKSMISEESFASLLKESLKEATAGMAPRDIERAWRRFYNDKVKFFNSAGATQIGKDIFFSREAIAKNKNILPRFVMQDSDIILLANKSPAGV